MGRIVHLYSLISFIKTDRQTDGWIGEQADTWTEVLTLKQRRGGKGFGDIDRRRAGRPAGYFAKFLQNSICAFLKSLGREAACAQLWAC